MLKENEILSKVLRSIEHYKGNIETFRSAVLRNDYTPAKSYFSRLFLWKTCLITNSLDPREWDAGLMLSRIFYHKLREEKDMRVQWHLLDEDNEFYLPQIASARGADHRSQPSPNHLQRIKNILNDPLASHVPEAESPSSSYQLDHDLLMSIIMDVQRLFPGEDFFHESSRAALKRKRQIVSTLYVWSKCNSSVGYKQGLHEIMGLIFINLHYELIEPSSTDVMAVNERQILNLYDEKFIEHDLFAIFNTFAVKSGVVQNFYSSESNLMSFINVFNMYLMKVDQLVHYNLVTKLRLESQLWIIRYLRLLLLRELGNSLEIPSLLWDKLAAIDTRDGTSTLPDTIAFLIVVLLIHIKTDLVPCDFPEALSLLLHYPILQKLKQYPNFIDIIFEDAFYLAKNRKSDFKLYEYGCKMNKRFNSDFNVKLGFTQSVNGSTSSLVENKSKSPSPAPLISSETRKKPSSKADKMAFEKYRLELRLKKRAQEVLHKK